MAKNTESSKGKLVINDNSDEEVDGESFNKGLEEFGFTLEKLTLGPKKKLLIFCLGGFLCDRVHQCEKHKILISRRHDTAYGNNLVYKRAHCEEFMKFCMERFEVAIWSCSKKFNLDSTLECLLKADLKSKLVFAWGQEKCTDTGFGSLENSDKPLFLKELKKVWQNNNDQLLPKFKGKFKPSNTLLVGHDPSTALLNPDHNGIFPEKYRAELRRESKEKALGPGSELRRYLEKLVDADNVPSFVKENPFGQMAITPKHPQWNYYSKVVSKSQKTAEKLKNDV